MMRMAQELPQAVQRLITEPAFSHHELIFKIAALIEHRCELALRAGHEPRPVANCYSG